MMHKYIIEQNRAEYDSFADVDDFMIYNKDTHYVYKHYQQNIKDILSKIKKAKINVLDVASGSGGVSRIFFEDKRCHVTAVDLSHVQLEFYKSKVDSDRITTMCMSVEDFCVKNNKHFDVVLISSALHHLYNYQRVLSDLLVSCHPRFVYIVREPKRHTPNGMLYKLFLYLDDCIQMPYNYYKNKSIKMYKRVAVMFCTPILSPVLRILEPYGNNPINFILRRRVRVPARYVEVHGNIDEYALCCILKSRRYNIILRSTPILFFSWMNELFLLHQDELAY